MRYRPLLLLALPTLAVGEITLDAEREAGPQGIPFELVIEAVQARPVTDPDFTPIEAGFEILNQQKLTRSSFKGGKSLYTSRWTLRLRPRQEGLLRIPPLVIGYERSPLFQYRAQAAESPPVTGSHSSDLQLTSSLGQSLVYSRAANVLTVKLLYAQPLSEAELTEPDVAGVRTVALGGPRHGETEEGGQVYRTIEQRYALLAQSPGRYRVAPIEFQGTGPGAPAGGYRLETEPQAFEAVLPPAEATTPWLPSTEVRLSARWDEPPEKIRAGDTRVRTLVAQAHGLPADWLPLPELTPPPGVRFYPQPARRFEETDNGTLVSRLEVDYRMLFTQQGEVTLPGWRLAWWDTLHDRPEQAELPPTPLSVGGFMETMEPQSPKAGELDKREPSQATAPATTSLGDANDQPGIPWTAWLWALIALICAGGWTLTRSRLKLTEQRLQETEEALTQRTQANNLRDYRGEEAEAYGALAHACHQDDPVLAARALIQWARYAWPTQTIGTFADLELSAQDPTLSYLLRNLEHNLSGADDDPWMGDLLLDQVDRLRRRRQRRAA